MRVARAAVFSSALAAGASAQTADTGKWGYTLFNPTPIGLRREMSADRPDFTESPYTVDAGAFQVELSLYDYARNGGDESLAVLPTNLKVGLLNNADLQVVLSPYVREDDDSGSIDGFGDTEVRLKINLWGNDGGETASGFMPFVKIPTGSGELNNDRVEGGLIFPFATGLSESVGLGLMFEADFVYDEEDGGYDTEFITTAALGFDLSDRVGAYAELIGIASTDSGVDYRLLIGAGATYRLRENVSLDSGVNVGITGEADDINIFSGVTFRF